MDDSTRILKLEGTVSALTNILSGHQIDSIDGEEIKRFMRLEDGDIIMSGTPKFNKNDCFVGRVYSDEKLLVEKEWVVQ